LSDVYSLGVMMFEVLAKRHPYVSCKGSFTPKQHAMNLRVAKIIKPSLLSYSLHIHKLLDIVVRMCSKASKSRITCQEIYEYLDKD
jgi:serine/threonine protein kinase